jgi:membrane protease YdiL (CAAX protease family)
MVLFAVTVVLVALAFPMGAYAVFSGRLSQNVTASTLIRPYYWIGPAVEFTPFLVSAGAWFAIFTAVYVAFLAYSVFQKERLGTAVAASFRGGLGALASSPFVVVILSIGFLTFTASMIDLLVSSAGAPIGGPSGDPLALLLSFSFSPLVEELGFRVLLIGTVALILSLSRPWKTALSALWRPSRAIEGFAVGSGASLIIWAAMGLSAVTFGVCHLTCGSGTWDIGKLPEAVYGGLVLGYLYIRYGFHVAVLAHWGVDFFGSVYAFFGQAAYGIPWNSATQEYVGQYAVDLDMLFLFGLASFLVVVYLGAKKLARWRSGSHSGEFDKAPLEGGGVVP